MSAHTEPLDSPDCSETSLDCFNIVLLYQDQKTAVRALQICEKIASGLDKTFQVNKSMWKFDLLNLPKMRALANEDAGGADMIIFAMRQDADLPDSVRGWIEDGLPAASEKPRALVALLSREFDALTGSALGYLRQFAETRSLDFFTNIEGDEEAKLYALPA